MQIRILKISVTFVARGNITFAFVESESNNNILIEKESKCTWQRNIYYTAKVHNLVSENLKDLRCIKT